MMNRILLLILVCLLSGCSTAITYNKLNENDLESTALKFRLQDSSLTLAVPSTTDNKAVQSVAVPSAPVAAGKSNCPAGVTSARWWECFNQVVPNAAIAASSGPTYVAEPNDASNLWFSTTAISGVAMPGQDSLYSQVTIKYKNNTSTIIAGAGSGAVAGFGIAGPYGAIGGFFLGGIIAAVPAAAPAVPAAAPAAPRAGAKASLLEYICESDKKLVNLSNTSAPALSSPLLYLPLTIHAVDARPIAPKPELVLPTETLAACWHTLPNTGHLDDLGIAKPVLAGVTTPPPTIARDPITGDGWLYRLVADKDDNPTQAPKGAISTDEYFNFNSSGVSGTHQDFPYSACRNVTLQVTWWKELADAINGHTSPKVVTVKTVVADPAYVFKAKVKNGGVITFKPDCGANVSMDADNSGAAAINAIVTATQNIYKAEQTWASSKKK
jgi:hypothetical protein